MTRVLVVHARGGLGDVVLSTPVLQALAQGVPAAEVTMLVRSAAAPLVEHNPYLQELIVVREGEWDHGAPFRKWIGDVRRRRFDIGVVLWSKAPEAWLLRRAGIPVRVGQAGRLLYSFNYTHQVSIRSERGDVDSHWTDIQLDYARRLGVSVDGCVPTLVVPLVPVELPAGPLIGFSVGKGLSLTPDRWPTATFARLADRLAQAFQATVVLTGSPDEIDIAGAVARAMRQPHVNLAGQTTLSQLTTVMQRCDAYVCPDSGPMHMAAALGVPTVGIFAMRCEFPHRWRPFGSHTAVVRPAPVTCPIGCQKETCHAFPCYEAVSGDALVEAVRQVIRPQVRS
ncbi:MAG TPA: glycosyltransferase family 9 protein [Candidatus Xenobia bacterium]|jgi:ADP-heptose:LPS heptosyltransferase